MSSIHAVITQRGLSGSVKYTQESEARSKKTVSKPQRFVLE